MDLDLTPWFLWATGVDPSISPPAPPVRTSKPPSREARPGQDSPCKGRPFQRKVGLTKAQFNWRQLVPKGRQLALGKLTPSPHTVDGRNPAPLRHHGKYLFVGIYRGIMVPGFLRWCRILSIHSRGEPNKQRGKLKLGSLAFAGAAVALQARTRTQDVG